MEKLFKFSVCFCLIFFCFLLVACNKDSRIANAHQKAAIGDVNYSSLTEAVEKAKTGDTIKVYEDIIDHKNVIIDKPLTIKGIASSNQSRPKFYGSFTINLPGQDDVANIENIEIVHDGINNDGVNNDTRIGVNILDGGLNMKKSKVMLNPATDPDKDSSGVIISRKMGSVSLSPITLEGNSFGGYETNKKDLSGAVIIKSGGNYQKLVLNEDKIYNDNSFSAEKEGNLFVSVDYSTLPVRFNYFVTSSTDEMINSLINNQSPSGSNYTLISSSPLTEKIENPIDIGKKTILSIEGNNTANFGGITLVVEGGLNVEGGVENLTLKRGSNLAGIIFGEGVDKTKIEILC